MLQKEIVLTEQFFKIIDVFALGDIILWDYLVVIEGA